MANALRLFDDAPDLSGMPHGFRYARDVIDVELAEQVIPCIRALPFEEFDFHGYKGRRRVVSFGWHYDFGARQLQPANPIPEFLLALRGPAAAFAGLVADDFQHVLVTEYAPGAAIGWHRDKAVFGDVVGLSFLASCTFRFRRAVGTKWERAKLVVEPRSAYLLTGRSRTEWEHSIPAVDELRYSVTFRTVR